MDGELRSRFRQHYAGRHDPDDALFWFENPGSTGPSSAPPPQQVYLDAVDQLNAEGHRDAATALLNAAAEVLDADRRDVLAALALARHKNEE